LVHAAATALTGGALKWLRHQVLARPDGDPLTVADDHLGGVTGLHRHDRAAGESDGSYQFPFRRPGMTMAVQRPASERGLLTTTSI
jgi:hypothetical protein